MHAASIIQSLKHRAFLIDLRGFHSSMRINPANAIFWIAFIFAIIILPLNFGLSLIAFGLLLLPILILHFAIGLNLNKIQDHKAAIIFSAINLLVFALIRPDGAHALNETGLSAVLDIFGIDAGHDRAYENHLFYSSLVLLLVQVIADLRLRKLPRR